MNKLIQLSVQLAPWVSASISDGACKEYSDLANEWLGEVERASEPIASTQPKMETIPFGPHFTCIRCSGKCLDHRIDSKGRTWCESCYVAVMVNGEPATLPDPMNQPNAQREHSSDQWVILPDGSASSKGDLNPREWEDLTQLDVVIIGEGVPALQTKGILLEMRLSGAVIQELMDLIHPFEDQ